MKWLSNQCLILVLSCVAVVHIQAQELFPDLSGADLLEAIQQHFTPTITLSYGEARDTLYARIDAIDDTIHGIYTGHAVWLDPSLDPTSALFIQDINTEHIYPQSKGITEGTQAYRNMHNLRPSLVNVNQDRASLPLLEIDDSQTNKWYRDKEVRTQPPQVDRDAYSEGNQFAFEPREIVKGDLARSIFYMYTIYQDQINSVDPTFFLLQESDLCTWHYADPVSSEELDRDLAIAPYQSDMRNPFIMDCTLADRLYCQSGMLCESSLTEAQADSKLSWYQDHAYIWFDTQGQVINQMLIHDMTGRLIWQERPSYDRDRYGLNIDDRSPGVYIAHIIYKNGQVDQTIFLIRY